MKWTSGLFKIDCVNIFNNENKMSKLLNDF